MKWDELVPTDGVDLTYRKEGWELWASWPQRGGRHEIVSLMRVRWHGAEPKLVMSTTRINVLSNSTVASVITAMNRAIGERSDPGIAEIVHEVCEDLIGWYQQGKAIAMPDPSRVRSTGGWLVYPIWPATGATAVAAAPGSYKSFMAQALAIELATGATVLNRNTSVKVPHSVLYLDWEADEGTFTERMAAINRGAGLELKPTIGYKQMSARLSDVAIGLAEEVTRGRFEAVVIDSMSAAIGAGMVDDDAVNGFWDAVRLISRPALIVAHKSAENIARKKARFFGSIMSEARVRMAWNAERAETTDHVVWECFKDNNTGHYGNKLAWQVEFLSEGEDEDRVLSTAGFLGVNPSNVMVEAPEVETQTVADQIANLLHAAGSLKVSQLASTLGKSEANIRAQLARHSERFEKLSEHSNSWSLTDLERGATQEKFLPIPL